jgi:hypothetical protein
MATQNNWANQVLDANVTFNGGSMNIGSDATDNVINIGTAANAGRTITIGNGTGTSAVQVNCGTGGASFGASANAHTTIIGSVTGASATTVQGGTGALNVTSSNGIITANSGTGTINISTDVAATTVNIASGAAVKSLTLGSSNTTSQTILQSGTNGMNINSNNGNMVINSGTGTLSVSNDATISSLNLGTGAAVKTISIGNSGVATTITAHNTISIASGNLSITAGNVLLPTTSATVGQIHINAIPVLQTYGTHNTFLGEEAGNFTLTVGSATFNTAIGYHAMRAITTGQFNIACGAQSLERCTTSPGNACLGLNALTQLTTGSGNNVAMGFQAGTNLLTGNGNTLVGSGAGGNYTTSESLNICFGNAGTVGESNTTRIGTESNQTNCYLAGNVTTTTSTAGATRSLTVANSDNTNAASTALIKASTGGASAGDPRYEATTTTTSWSWGIDNSATVPSADPFVISQGTALGTTDVMRIATSGEITMPLQPAFLAYLSSTLSDATGDNTSINPVPFDTEVFDQNSDYDSGTYTFTASVTGRYAFVVRIYYQQLADTNTIIVATLATSNRNYFVADANGTLRDGNNNLAWNGSAFADMDAGDTATVSTIVYGASKVVDINGSGTATSFSGWLVC